VVEGIAPCNSANIAGIYNCVEKCMIWGKDVLYGIS